MRRLTITTKEGEVKPLEPNWAQQELLAEIERQRENRWPVRIIVLKARQLGISTVTEGVMFWNRFIYTHTFGLVVAHESDASENLFGMTRKYWDNFPYKSLFQQKYHSKKELAWVETGSSIRIATAKNTGAGRSRTIMDLHASEVAFWENAKTLVKGLRQAVPQSPASMILLESTANGVGGFFHETWQAAEARESEFVPMFFPWWRHPEYTAAWLGIPARVHAPVTMEERALRALGVDDDHLAWRRYALRNLVEKEEDFHQEYPSTPEEAFIAAGKNVFNLDKLRVCYQPMNGVRGRLVRRDPAVEFQRDPTGPLTIFRLPSKNRRHGVYFVAGDPCHAHGDDFACAQVINRRTYEQVAVWHAKIDPISFAHELVKLAKFYNQATIAPEVEGPGYATIGALVTLEYPFLWRHTSPDRVPGAPAQQFGWSTNRKRKAWALGELNKLLVDESLVIHDKFTYEQMRIYVELPGGEFGPAEEGAHDDRVSGLLIAVVCSQSEGLINADEEDSPFAQEQEPAWASAAATPFDEGGM